MTFRSEFEEERAYATRAVRALGLLAKYQGENWFDTEFHDFAGALEGGRVHHTRIPGWFLIRSWCTSCNEEVTAIRYHGRRICLVPNGQGQMGKYWAIHQCPHPYDIGPEEGQIEPDPYEQETYPDDPCVRDGDGEIRAGGFYDERET